MWKFGYTIFMTIVTYVLFQLNLYWGDVDAQVFYLIGELSLCALYFLIGFPTLLITNVDYRPSIGSRVKIYFITTFIGIIVFILFFLKIAEYKNSEIYEIIIPYSIFVGILAGIFYFTPIEIIRVLKIKAREK